MSSLVRRMATVVAVAGALALPVVPHEAQAHGGLSVSVQFFYDSLAPYGRWMNVAPYGTVWMPAGMGPTWRPYTTGHWIYADCGWTWVADEPWGWAPFHYGRWAFEPAYGWLWVPGSVWAPAWVAWRWGGGYVGWAPLAPVMGYDIDYWGGPTTVVSFGWSFIGEREILAPSVRTVIVPRSRVPVLVERTRDVTRYDRDGDRVISRAVDPTQLARITGRRIPVHRVIDAREVGAARVQGDELRIYRPPARLVSERVRSQQPAAAPAGRAWGTHEDRERSRTSAPAQVLPRASQGAPVRVPSQERERQAAPAPAYGRPGQPVYRPAQPVSRVTPQPVYRPAQPASRVTPQPVYRPAQPASRVTPQQVYRPAQPASRVTPQPVYRPGQPASRAPEQVVRHAQPVSRSPQAAYRPAQPASRPTAVVAPRPAPRPAARPAPQQRAPHGDPRRHER